MAENKDVQELQLVTFILAGEEYAVDILQVREIILLVEITAIPNAPVFVEGIINLRGRVIPIIDIKQRFGLDSVKDNEQMRIVIIEISGMTMGIIVDSVSEVLRLPADAIEPAPDLVSDIDEEYIKGVGKLDDRLLILLDMDKLLKKDELHKMKAHAKTPGEASPNKEEVTEEPQEVAAPEES